MRKKTYFDCEITIIQVKIAYHDSNIRYIREILFEDAGHYKQGKWKLMIEPYDIIKLLTKKYIELVLNIRKQQKTYEKDL